MILVKRQPPSYEFVQQSVPPGRGVYFRPSPRTKKISHERITSLPEM